MALTVEQLYEHDSEAAKALLAREPSAHLYLLGVLDEFGVVPADGAPEFAFFGAFDRRELKAVLFVGGQGGLVIPSNSPRDALLALYNALQGKFQAQAALGEPEALELLWRHWSLARPRVALKQRLYQVSADDLGPFTNPTLRLATEEDLPDLLKLAAGAVKERFGRDPTAEDPMGFRSRVLMRIRAKRTYVLWSGQTLVFKVDLGARSQWGAELEGLYTLPAERKKGHATLSLGQISRHLLSSLPRLTLRIDDDSPVLARVAQKVGFMGGPAQKLFLR